MGKMSSGMRMMAMARAQGGSQGNYNSMGDGGRMSMMDAPEMRRRRDSRGRYMEDDGGSRMAYDGNQGRMKYGGNEGAYRPWPEPHMPPYLDKPGMEDNMRPGRERRNQYGEMRDSNVVNIQDYQDKRKIGFGENRMHHGEWNDEEYRHGHTGAKARYPMMEQLTEEVATAWVEDLENTDPEHPKGPKWNREAVKPLAIKHGFTTTEKQLEFWAVMNMMYSDYAETAKKHGVSTLDFYADMAKSWMRDKDAVEHKTAAYIACCTK